MVEGQLGLATEQWHRVDRVLPLLDAEARFRAAELTGSLIMKTEIDVHPVNEKPNPTTLLADTQIAALGDALARQRIRTNVTTDMSERMFKVEDQSRVMMRFVNGELEQNGRKLKDVHRNTIENTYLNPVMRGYASAELRNAHLFELLHSANIFDTHSAVVFSCATTDRKTQRDYGFFEDTLSCSVQLLQAQGNQAQLQTALVAGKQSSEADRHDVATIIAMAEDKGLDLEVVQADDMVQFMILIPNEEVTNGVTDVVAMFDGAAREVTGEEMFYGQAKPRQDYIAHAEMCHKRHQEFEPMVEAITNQLIREAAGFKTPLEAITRLDELSEQYSVRQAIYGHVEIDAKVFGAQSAAYIQQARELMERGDVDQAETAVNKAIATADSSSCPFLKSKKNKTDLDSDDSEVGEKKWMNCPFCKARVYGDPCAKSLKCTDCHAHVMEGEVVNEGDGGSAKRRELMRQRAVERLRKLQAIKTANVNNDYALAR